MDKIKKQIDWDSDIRNAVWTEIVTDKIRKQALFLHENNHAEGDKLLGYICLRIGFESFVNSERNKTKTNCN